MAETLVPLTRETIDAVFAKAIDQYDYTFDLYRIVFPNFDLVDHCVGHPKVAEETNEYIFSKAIDFDQHNHPGVQCGGLWMNVGFGADVIVPPWFVRPCSVVMKGP